VQVKTRNFALGLAILGLLLLAWTFAGANRRVVRTMTWYYAESSPQWPSSKHIVLTFVDYPHHFIGVYSPDLGTYLESLPGRQVQVVFEVSPVFGGMHGRDWINPAKLLELEVGRLRGNLWHHTVQFGQRTYWHSDFSYSGREGNTKGSPWD
jgi:hypothetical protein